MSVKAVLFDADGVVINSELFFAFYKNKNKISNEEINQFFGGIFQECLINNADLKQEIEKKLISWKWKGSVDELLLSWFNFENK
ncbi:MAG: hypothetical protein Q7T35_02490, partial [Nitrosomonas sp.]|nr:hypothetical protein [Nitrosomonas sp.]